MLDLDSMSVTDLEDFIDKAESKGNRYAEMIFPEKNPGFRRALNLMVKYAKERIEVLENERHGRDRAKKHEERANGIYRLFPDYAKWDLTNENLE